MSRCQICGKVTSNPVMTWDTRYSVFPDGEIMVCSSCFDLLAVYNYDELDKKILEKLKVIRK